jgi:MYXO-CTERM domain-containing protein
MLCRPAVSVPPLVLLALVLLALALLAQLSRRRPPPGF